MSKYICPECGSDLTEVGIYERAFAYFYIIEDKDKCELDSTICDEDFGIHCAECNADISNCEFLDNLSFPY